MCTVSKERKKGYIRGRTLSGEETLSSSTHLMKKTQTQRGWFQTSDIKVHSWLLTHSKPWWHCVHSSLQGCFLKAQRSHFIITTVSRNLTPTRYSTTSQSLTLLPKYSWKALPRTANVFHQPHSKAVTSMVSSIYIFDKKASLVHIQSIVIHV